LLFAYQESTSLPSVFPAPNVHKSSKLKALSKRFHSKNLFSEIGRMVAAA
jgi:hypothetical protein